MTVLTTDFHTHILPGIDDGCVTVEESLQLLRTQQLQGVNTVLLTPHFYAQQLYPDVFLERRNLAMETLQKALTEDLSNLKLILGAEVHFYPGMSRWEQLRELTIGDTDYILIEMPATKWTDSTYEELGAIYQLHGITPILAHIERYFLPLRTQKMLDRLSDLPLLLQFDCEFLNDPRTRRQALRLLNAQKVHLLGSDCHDIANRVPSMAKSREILLECADPSTLSFLSDIENAVLGR